jgi:hypothetical protein
MEKKQKSRFGDTPNKKIKSYFHEKRYATLVDKIKSLKFGKSKNKGIIDIAPNFRISILL